MAAKAYFRTRQLLDRRRRENFVAGALLRPTTLVIQESGILSGDTVGSIT
jgi:hypothetical protein